jgi:hypothetical protein
MALLLLNATSGAHPVCLQPALLGPHHEIYAVTAGDTLQLSRQSEPLDVPHSGWQGDCQSRLTDVRSIDGITYARPDYSLDIRLAAPAIRRLADASLQITYTGVEPICVVIASEITARALAALIAAGGPPLLSIDPTDVLRGCSVVVASPILSGDRSSAVALQMAAMSRGGGTPPRRPLYLVIHTPSRDCIHSTPSYADAIAHYETHTGVYAVIRDDDPRVTWSPIRGWYVPAGDKYYLSPGIHCSKV